MYPRHKARFARRKASKRATGLHLAVLKQFNLKGIDNAERSTTSTAKREQNVLDDAQGAEEGGKS